MNKEMLKLRLKYIRDLIKNPDLIKVLNKKDDNLSYIESICLSDYNKECNKIFNEKYSTLENCYQILLYNLALLITNIKEDVTLDEIEYIFCYILFNGYLSKDNKFTFDEPINEIKFKRSLSIFKGQGVCRNICILLSDLLKTYEIENYGIITDISTHKRQPLFLNDEFAELIGYDDDIVNENIRQLENNTNMLSGNHFELLVHDNGWYLLDPTNVAFYKILRRKNNYPTSYFFKYWYLFTYGELSVDECMNIYRKLKDKYLYRGNPDMVYDKQDACYELCEKNKEKILEFNNNNKQYIDLLSKVKQEKGLI
jgi:hypothetical protein